MDAAREIGTAGAAEFLAGARRVVVKIGSALVAGADGPDSARLASLADDLAALRARGAEIILVSSGAIALGRRLIGGSTARLADKQAAAAVGQTLLMEAWGAALAPHGIVAGQLLLSPDDTETRRRWLNARATVDALLARGIVPVVNENDSVATEEIRYGDNDRLAARTAQLARADLLVLLSDVDGLYTADPRVDAAAAHLPLVEALTPDVLAMAGGARRGGVGTGGMATKLAAAQIARAAGCATIIAAGLEERPLSAILTGARATVLTAPEEPMAAYKGWIAGSLKVCGTLTLDEGAVAALKAGRSLLPAGIAAVAGGFGKGDCVAMEGPDGERIGLGIVGYPASELARIRGQRSEATEALIGYRGPAEAVHRDDMVLDR